MYLTTAATTISATSSARSGPALILTSMDPADVRRWIDGWAGGWAAHDVPRIAALYAVGPVQRSEPFRERQAPRADAAWAFSAERTPGGWFAEPHVTRPAAPACPRAAL